MPIEIGAASGQPASKTASLFFDFCRYEIENLAMCCGHEITTPLYSLILRKSYNDASSSSGETDGRTDLLGRFKTLLLGELCVYCKAK